MSTTPLDKNKLISTERARNENELDEEQLSLASSLLDNVLLRMELPNCFGLYGNWGTGKTSFMNAIRKIIKENYPNEIECVYFEPWKYENSNHKDLLFALLSQIKKETKSKKPLWKKLLVNSCSISSGLLRLPGSLEFNGNKLAQIDVHNTIKDLEFFEKKYIRSMNYGSTKLNHLKKISRK